MFPRTRETLATGRFACCACCAWGYLEEARQRWREEQQRLAALRRPPARPPRPPHQRPGSPAAAACPAPPPPARHLAAFHAALPGSRGAAYLRQRGIPLALAQRLGVGSAAPGTWPHPARDWRGGRVVLPHTTPDGRLVNLYGRAVGSVEQVPKAKRHDHLPGEKGYFNAAALQAGAGPLWVCEGAFDTLALRAADVPHVMAIFGVQGWRWAWAREVRELVFALDAAAAGQPPGRARARQAGLLTAHAMCSADAGSRSSRRRGHRFPQALGASPPWRGAAAAGLPPWRALARRAARRGKQVAALPAAAYGGHKDANAAWAAGVLRIGAWPAAAERPSRARHGKNSAGRSHITT